MTKKLTKKQFVQKANEKHGGDKYDYREFIYINSSTKGKIMCQEHGTFLQTPSNHLRGKGCPKCGNLNRGKSNRSNKDAFILKANEKHDNKYDYTLVDYKRLKTHITIICPEHGNFIQSPDNHLQGAGCSKCGRKRTEDGHRLTTEEFVSKAKKIHTCDKYNYTQVDYKGAKIKVTIICPEHGKFKQTPTGHLSGKGCLECAIKKNSDNQRGTKESFIQKSRANPSCRDHNGNYYDYDLVEYKNAHTKVKIKCLYHDKIFTMIPNNHSHHGQKCNDCGLLCSKGFRYSKIGCKWIEEEMKKDNISIQYALSDGGEFKPIKDKKILCDGFCEETNTIYEFHGDYWHGNPSKYNQSERNPTTKKKYGTLFIDTCMREKKYLDAGYKYKCIWESVYRQTNKI